VTHAVKDSFSQAIEGIKQEAVCSIARREEQAECCTEGIL
jgi:hypothetical protein